jgi:hypothetical protein
MWTPCPVYPSLYNLVSGDKGLSDFYEIWSSGALEKVVDHEWVL